MKTFAKAILNLAAFIELSPDDQIDPDSAVKALEQLSLDLSSASKAELSYLKAVIIQESMETHEERTSEQQDRITFFLDFIENMGIE